MNEILSVCIKCGATETIVGPDFGPPEPGDLEYEGIEADDDKVPAEGHQHPCNGSFETHLCEGCSETLEATFAAPSCGTSGTLAGIVDRYSTFYLRLLAEEFDPGIREAMEVFPNLETLGGRPARRRMDECAESLAPALARIGKPVAIFDPRPENEGVEFVLVRLYHDGIQICCDYVGHHEMSQMDAVSAFNYAPDGTPLSVA